MAENLEALRDVVWRILTEIGIDHKYLPTTQDGMPMPKPGYVSPYFDQATWDQLTQAILEAMAILKAQAVKEAQSNRTIPASR